MKNIILSKFSETASQEIENEFQGNSKSNSLREQKITFPRKTKAYFFPLSCRLTWCLSAQKKDIKKSELLHYFFSFWSGNPAVRQNSFFVTKEHSHVKNNCHSILKLFISSTNFSVIKFLSLEPEEKCRVTKIFSMSIYYH